MKTVFVSNYINHHQRPFCEAMRRRLGDDFIFIQTEPMEEERLRMGWSAADGQDSYVLHMEAGGEKAPEAARMIAGCDILLAGWAPGAEEEITKRLEKGGITFRLSERIYKDGQWKAVSPRGLISKYKAYTRFRNAPYYLLCAGAYVASDFQIIGAFPGKKYRWGYFPRLREYSEEKLPASKGENQLGEEALFTMKRKRPLGEGAQIIWAGRFVDFKNPQLLPIIVKSLAAGNDSFHLHIAGGGDGEEEIRRQIEQDGMISCVTFHGFMPPERVRDLMEQCDIHLMTSDAGEGWGAVLNESMNSGCAAVAGTEAGAAPFLIRSGENGLLYNRMDTGEMISALGRLVSDPVLCEKLGREAYKTITSLWNADVAAGRLLEACEYLMQYGTMPDTGYCDGPMSPDPGWKPFLKV